MQDYLGTFLLEIGIFTFFGVLYYFYQRRKILQFEKNKGPIVMGMILQSCLTEKSDDIHPELDAVIEALDDYLLNRSPVPPTTLLKKFADGQTCSPELKEVIHAGITELESSHD